MPAGRRPSRELDLMLEIFELTREPGVEWRLDEIAAFVGCSLQRISQLEHRALARMRRELTRLRAL